MADELTNVGGEVQAPATQNPGVIEQVTTPNGTFDIYEDARWGVYGTDIVPSIFYQVYRLDGSYCADDEALYYTFPYDDEEHISTIEITEGGELYKTKYAATSDSVTVKITPATALKEQYPYAHVVVDGKEHTLGLLDNDITLSMGSNHRIVIEWTVGVREVFRIVKVAAPKKNVEEEGVVEENPGSETTTEENN